MPFSRISLLPAHDLLPEIAGEFVGATRRRRHARLPELAANLWIVQHCHLRGIELGDHRRRGERRRQRACPLVADRIGEALLDEGRHLGKNLRAFLRGRRQRLELPGFDLRHDGRHVAEQAVELAAEQIGHGLRRAAIGHRLELDAGGGLIELKPEMGDGAEPGDADGDGAGPSLASAASSRAELTFIARSPPAWSS